MKLLHILSSIHQGISVKSSLNLLVYVIITLGLVMVKQAPPKIRYTSNHLSIV